MIISLPALAVPESVIPFATLGDSNVSGTSKTNTFKNVFDALALFSDGQASSGAEQHSDNSSKATDKKDVTAGSMAAREALTIVDTLPPPFSSPVRASVSTGPQDDSKPLKGDQNTQNERTVSAANETPEGTDIAETNSLPIPVSSLGAASSTIACSANESASNVQQSVILSAVSRMSVRPVASYKSLVQYPPVEIPKAQSLTQGSSVPTGVASQQQPRTSTRNTVSTANTPAALQPSAGLAITQLSTHKMPQSAPGKDASISPAPHSAATTVSIATPASVEAHTPTKAVRTVLDAEIQLPAAKIIPPSAHDLSHDLTASPTTAEIAPATVRTVASRSMTVSNVAPAQAPVARFASVSIPTAPAPNSQSYSAQLSVSSNPGAKQTGMSPVVDEHARTASRTEAPQPASQSTMTSDSTSSDSSTTVAPAPVDQSTGTAPELAPAQPTATPTTVSPAPAIPSSATANANGIARQAPASPPDISMPDHQMSTASAAPNSGLVPKAENLAFAARMAGMEASLETVSSPQSGRTVTQNPARLTTSDQTISDQKNAATPAHSLGASSNDAAQADTSPDVRHSASAEAPGSDKAAATSNNPAPAANIHDSYEAALASAGAPVVANVQSGSSTIATAPAGAAHTNLPFSAQEPHLLTSEMPKPSTSTEILLHLTDGDQTSAAIRVADRAGAVNVSVHASDPTLRESLRSNLDELSSQLNSQGWKADIIKTAAAVSHSDAQQDARSDGERGFHHQQQQGSGSDRQSQRDRRGNSGRWQQEFDQQITGGEAHAGGKA